MAAKKTLLNERGEKLCTGCNSYFPLEEFHVQKSHSTGRKAKCKKCGCKQSLQYYFRHPEKNVESQRRYRARHREKVNARVLQKRHQNPDRAIFYFAKMRARKSGLPFNIDLGDVVVPERCPILGVPLVVGGNRRQHDYSPTIDRIIPALGYTKGNVRVISWRANRIKSDATVEELRAIVRYIEFETCRKLTPAAIGGGE